MLLLFTSWRASHGRGVTKNSNVYTSMAARLYRKKAFRLICRVARTQFLECAIWFEYVALCFTEYRHRKLLLANDIYIRAMWVPGTCALRTFFFLCLTLSGKMDFQCLLHTLGHFLNPHHLTYKRSNMKPVL